MLKKLNCSQHNKVIVEKLEDQSDNTLYIEQNIVGNNKDFYTGVLNGKSLINYVSLSGDKVNMHLKKDDILHSADYELLNETSFVLDKIKHVNLGDHGSLTIIKDKLNNVGISFRNPKDSFNKKLGVLKAISNCKTNKYELEKCTSTLYNHYVAYLLLKLYFEKKLPYRFLNNNINEFLVVHPF